MNTEDFRFFYRKDFLILCLLLIATSYALIASEQLSTIRIVRLRDSSIEPIFIFNNPLLEILGIFLPLLAAIFLLFQKKTKNRFDWVPPRRALYYLGMFLLIVIVSFQPPTFQEEVPTNNTSIPFTGTIPITDTAPVTNPTNPQQPNVNNQLNPGLLAEFFDTIRNVLIFLILFLSVFMIFLIKDRFSNAEIKIIEEDIQEEVIEEKPFQIQTILECYYQASNRLEERGANKAFSLTPTEFSDDVIDKEMIYKEDIEGLTDLFEEAKFSENDMTTQQVNTAKSITSRILFSEEEIDEDLSQIKDHSMNRD